MVKLRKDKLETWISKYNLQNVNYKVAIIMAGNFPLAGLHDLATTFDQQWRNINMDDLYRNRNNTKR